MFKLIFLPLFALLGCNPVPVIPVTPAAAVFTTEHYVGNGGSSYTLSYIPIQEPQVFVNGIRETGYTRRTNVITFNVELNNVDGIQVDYYHN